MSFSSEIKSELCHISDMNRSDMPAMLYGLFYAGRIIDGRAAIQTENADLVAAARQLTEEVFPNVRHETTRLVKNGGSLFTFTVKDGYERIRERFGDFSENTRINSAVVSGNDDESGAFLRGVFVSCGSVTDPQKEYHLELVLPYNTRAKALHSFINEHGMAIKTTQRSRGLVLYAKESELIEDFLTYIGAALRSLEIMQVKIEKSVRNRVNRTVNCETANLDKTINAANRICEDIEFLLRERGADYLKPELRMTALLRLENREASLSELCELLSDSSSGEKPLSKSGLNHRLKKLSKMADELRLQAANAENGR